MGPSSKLGHGDNGFTPSTGTHNTGFGTPSTSRGSVGSKRASFLSNLTVSAFRNRPKSPTPSTSSASSTAKGDANSKGPLGLTTITHPKEAEGVLAHIIFVHGLGGGSEHTWTKDGVFWPRDLLPSQDPFQNASIHTFGYDSDYKKSSTLNITDFSKSLLNSLLNNPNTRDPDVGGTLL